MSKKQVVSLFLVLGFVIIFATNVFASGTQISLSKQSCIAGEKVNVELVMPENSGVTSVRLEIAFDENVLKLTEVSDGGILGKANHSNLLKSPYVLSWENDMLRENITSTGVIATLTFEVDDNATQKEYPVTVVRAEVLNTNIEDVECNITDGSISVTKKEVEDVSSGEVTTTIGGSGSYTDKPAKNQETTTLENTGISKIVYSDVGMDDWFYGCVTLLSEKGVVSGNGNGEFAPNDNVTREQFLKMLLEAVGTEYANVENTFADVDNSAWYAKYVLNAKKIGIVNGVSDVEFGIGENITRQDMAVMISRTIEKFYIDVSFAVVDAFDDSDVISDYAKKSVNAMKSIGLIEGYNNKFRPIDNLTRAEAAKVISELIDIDK